MREYFGSSAKQYQQTKGKQYLLFPALKRLTPKVNETDKLLDVGCGNGDFCSIANELGYEYFGFDLSPDLIERAMQDYPSGNFSVASATEFEVSLPGPFNVIVISTLFPAIESKADITQILREAKRVLAKTGRVLVGVQHPCFDGYMQHGILGRSNISTQFSGYFTSGMPYQVNHTIDGHPFSFHDYHWTLNDYVQSANEAGFSVESIDECYPDFALKNVDKAEFEKRISFPTYMVIVLR